VWCECLRVCLCVRESESECKQTDSDNFSPPRGLDQHEHSSAKMPQILGPKECAEPIKFKRNIELKYEFKDVLGT
jgi:hypothetical protein